MAPCASSCCPRTQTARPAATWEVPGSELVLGIASSNTAVATVSTNSVAIVACNTLTSPVSIHAVGSGSATITLSFISVTTNSPATSASDYNLAPGAFQVNVAAAPPSDSTPPLITPNVNGTLGANGWFTSDVSISWSIVDNESSVSSSSGCGSTTIDGDTTGTTLACTATSAGGTSSQSVTIKRDATKPTINGVASPAPNGDGWNNTDVTVSFSCGDNLAGVASCGPDRTLTSEGTGQSATGTAVDAAGNSDTATTSGINIDKTAPDVTASPSLAAIDVGGTDWYKDTVDFAWAATDPDLSDSSPGSGVKTGPTPAVSTFNTTATGQSASSEASDYAENAGTGNVSGINVDADAPAAQFTDCPTSPLILGSVAPTIHWTASDLGSGLESAASGSVTLDTSTVDSRTANSPAPQDNVGHTGTAAGCTYSVIYDWHGFFSPVENPNAWNSAKAGQSIPIKFNLGGDQGLNILASGFPRITQVTCPSSGTPPDPIEEYATTTANSKLIYDALADQYNYVWKTDKMWASKCFRLDVKFIDNTTHSAYFKFTK